jgi:hypothetical protein
MGLVDRLKAAVTPVPPPYDGEDDYFFDIEDDAVAGEDADDSQADQTPGDV